MAGRTSASTIAALLVAALAGCSSRIGTQFGPCQQDPPDPACSESCNPSPHAPLTCPAGFHCDADGRCDAACTADGFQCGAGFYCSVEGECRDDDPTAHPDAEDPVCASLDFTPARIVPSVALLVDRSGSMAEPFGEESTRWDAVRVALVGDDQGQGGVVKAMQHQIAFGCNTFAETQTCPELSTQPTAGRRAVGNLPAIRLLLLGEQPLGGTPTGPAIDAVVADFAAHPPYYATAPKVIVLATDGEPFQCGSSSPQPDGQLRAVTAARNAHAAGITLYILAVDGDIAPAHLQDMANAGAGVEPGMPDAPYFVATSPDILRDQLTTLLTHVAVSCTLSLEGTIDPSYADTGVVTLDGQPLVYDVDWHMPDGHTIELLGAACDALNADDGATIAASFPCEAAPVD